MPYDPATREVKSVQLNATKEHPLKITPLTGDHVQLVRCEFRGRRSPGSPSLTLSLVSGYQWIWTNQSRAMSNRCTWVTVAQPMILAAMSIRSTPRQKSGTIEIL